uniref:helix-turn-helix domain-containing protein n=1 Tax=Hafnia alvei TaxID=569 RepID=UPI00242ED5A8|nr:helix-turn-helix domain-containing protein [Hafnia alvei]
MTGFELRLWRRGFGWDQERAAEELDISLRTYKRYESRKEIEKIVELATEALTLREQNGRV